MGYKQQLLVQRVIASLLVVINDYGVRIANHWQIDNRLRVTVYSSLETVDKWCIYVKSQSSIYNFKLFGEIKEPGTLGEMNHSCEMRAIIKHYIWAIYHSVCSILLYTWSYTWTKFPNSSRIFPIRHGYSWLATLKVVKMNWNAVDTTARFFFFNFGFSFHGVSLN